MRLSFLYLIEKEENSKVDSFLKGDSEFNGEEESVRMDVINLIERDMFKYLSCICDLFIKGKAIFLEVYLTDIRGTL